MKRRGAAKDAPQIAHILKELAGKKCELAVKALDKFISEKFSGLECGHFTIAISAAGRQTQWPQSLYLLDAMDRASVPADVISYNATIKALGSTSKALEILETMRKRKVMANVVSYSYSKFGNTYCAFLFLG